MDNKGQVSGLLALIAVVVVGGVITLQIFNQVLDNSMFENYGILLSVQNSFIPLFVLAGVAGAVIAVLLFSFGNRR